MSSVASPAKGNENTEGPSPNDRTVVTVPTPQVRALRTRITANSVLGCLRDGEKRSANYVCDRRGPL